MELDQLEKEFFENEKFRSYVPVPVHRMILAKASASLFKARASEIIKMAREKETYPYPDNPSETFEGIKYTEQEILEQLNFKEKDVLDTGARLSEHKAEIWKEGFRAGIEGLTFNDNPYKP